MKFLIFLGSFPHIQFSPYKSYWSASGTCKLEIEGWGVYFFLEE